MEIAYISLLVVVAATIGTLSGFGTSTVMVPVMLLFLPLPETLLLVGVIHWFGNIWKTVLFKSGIRWRLILLFGLPGIVATYIGASFVFSAPEMILSRILGGFLAAYAIFLFFNSSFGLRQNNLTAAVGGASYGFVSGIFGVGGEVRGAFLSAFNLPKAVYIATTGFIGLAVDSSRLVAYWSGGIRLDSMFVWGLILFIPASFLGAYIAKKVVNKISQEKFRSVIAIFLFVIGVKLLFF
ncbi:MAG: sulfite exporter TauE/SafE family protein [Candidatus Paceibacterota bacterium]